MKEKAYQDALAFNPNIVVIKLGTNDSKSFNWKYKEDFTKRFANNGGCIQCSACPTEDLSLLSFKSYRTGDNINDDIISKRNYSDDKESCQEKSFAGY